ncbi:MAG: phosphatase PAP2 family protein [Proteobacteria bacterium]|nr:phosphatase PAP2 family protein [Pseudomonadota bacterium]MBU1714848.1 phosphatase PAP2 family protein [Pseudomonadota bacterium]
MAPKFFFQTRRFNFSFWGIIALGAVIGSIYLWDNDLSLSLYWRQRAAADPFLHDFARFMARTLPEDGIFGGQDLSYLLLLPYVIFYLICAVAPPMRRKYQFSSFYQSAGYITAAALAMTAVNRGMKTFFARARPGDLGRIKDGLAQEFSRMWEVGSQSPAAAFSNGSFPSGHTNTAVALVVLVYILMPTNRIRLVVGRFLLAISWAMLMGFGRVCSGSHYPSDVLWSIVIGLLLLGWIYFRVLRVPEQRTGKFRIYTANGELLWGLSFFMFVAGITSAAVGIRYFVTTLEWRWFLAFLGGAFGTFIFYRLMDRILVDPDHNQGIS